MSRKINIGLNALGLIPGRIGGAETYFRSLANSLQKVDGSNSYILLCNEQDGNLFPINNPRFSIKTVKCPPKSLKWYMRGALRNLVGIDLLNPFVYKCKIDLLHHPFTLLSPTCPKIPSVVTFLDLQHEYLPEFFTPFEKAYRDRNYRASAKNASRIIAISKFTRDSLVERYGIDDSKIDVIYPGCTDGFTKIENDVLLHDIRNKYGLEQPFMLYPAASWPHKNHATLIDAVRILREVHQFQGQLVLTGIAMQSHGEIVERINRLGLAGVVKVLGYVDYGDLPSLYSMARLMVFPSLFEGFGIPLVEAMACGCPIVCSNVTSLPEVGGDACEFFSPYLPEEIADKIWSVWSDDTKRELLRSKGFERAALFEWSDTAKMTLDVYEKIGT